MKQKIFSLLVLLMVAVSGAWAADVLNLVVSGTSATIKYDGNASNNPYYYVDRGWEQSGDRWDDESTIRPNITTVTIDESCKNFSGTSLSSLFSSFSGLTTINGLENLNTVGVQDMEYMFNGCSSLTSLDLSSVNTASVTTMFCMFAYCSKLTSLDLSSWNTENVQMTSSLFSECSELTTVDLSGWNTENVENTNYMFGNCPKLENIYVGDGWSTAAVTSSVLMFDGCTKLLSMNTANPATDKTNAHTGDGGYLKVKPAGDYAFTVAPADHGSGTVKFYIGDEEVKGAMQADEGKTVTMTVTPDEGWVVDDTKVKAESYSTWEAAGAPSRRAPGNIQILGDVTLTKSTTAENTWTFTMPAASVLVGTGYKKVSNLAFKPADKTNLITVEVDNVVKNRDPQDATKNVNIRRVQNLLEGTSVKLTANTGYKFRKVEVKKGVDYSFDLSTLTSNFEAMDGDILYGTTDKTVTIPNGAHVTLNGVNITSAAAIVCNGNATITLAAGSENTVTSTTQYNSGIRAGGNNTTLTINGTGKLTVQGAKRGAGIGSNRRGVCGNIVIEDGEIITSTGDYGAGIGSGYHATCGNITIKGGTITATGGNCAAGIGSSFDNAICGDILISGGTITANGGSKAAGIGTGSAQQGFPSTCGKITITDGVTKVTATKGSSAALHSIGKGQNEQNLAACGTVTIGGVEGYISESPYTYDPHQQ